MKFKYQIGQRVRHEDTEEEGVIVRQLDSSEVDEDMDPGEPWYEIQWDTWEPGDYGNEPEDVLSLI